MFSNKRVYGNKAHPKHVVCQSCGSVDNDAVWLECLVGGVILLPPHSVADAMQCTAVRDK